MSLNVASATALVARPSVVAQNAGSTSGGGLLSIGGGSSAITGALTAQPGTGANILKRMLVGGIAGAALGFGASFFTLPIIGQVAAPIAAAVGGGIGAALGLVTGLWSRHKARVAQAQAQQQQLPMATAPAQSIAPPRGKTFRLGQSGSQVKTTQRYLKKFGLYNGKITGKVDAGTASAIRKYEIMKGAMPTGACSPDLRVALAQDVRIMAQLG